MEDPSNVIDSTETEIEKFCKRYKCVAIDCSDKENIVIQSSCGHQTKTSKNKILKKKIGVYCFTCTSSLISSGTATCLAFSHRKTATPTESHQCKEFFVPTAESFLFCSKACANFRVMTDERKLNITNGVRKLFPQYMNDDGSLKSGEEVEKIRKKRKRDVTQGNPQELAKRKHLAYDSVKQMYEEGGCKLLTSEQEYEENIDEMGIRKFRFSIISTCGHTSQSLYYGFVESNTGKQCKECTHENAITILKSNAKTDDGHSRALVTQKLCLDKIREACSDKFEIKKVRDGCESNIIIRPIGSTDDIWLNIKVKCMDENNSNGTARARKLDANVVSLVVCAKTFKFWIFLPSELKTFFCMGIRRNKHQKHIVEDLNSKFLELYLLNKFNYSVDFANTPISPTVQLEYIYAKKREEINFLQIEYPEISCSVFNFKIVLNELCKLKVQESIFTGHANRTTLTSKFHKNNGRKVTQAYDIGDSDIYWMHTNNGSRDFYVIPETVLATHGYFKSNLDIGRKWFTISKMTQWVESFRFNYATINSESEKNRLMTLLTRITK